jgi:hypothetical protein
VSRHRGAEGPTFWMCIWVFSDERVDEAAAGDAKFADPEGGDEADEKEKGVVYHNETVQQPQVAATLEG